MKNRSIKTTFHEPISSLQLTGTNTPVSINSKVKTSKHFLKHYIASYFDQSQQEHEGNSKSKDYTPSLTEPNQFHDVSLPNSNKFKTSQRERVSLIKAKTTVQASFPCKLTKLPPLVLTKIFNHDYSLDTHKTKEEVSLLKNSFQSPVSKIQNPISTKLFHTPQPYMHSPKSNKQQQPCIKLQTIIEKCDLGIKEVQHLSGTIDSIKSIGVCQTINLMRHQQMNIKKEEANLFAKTKSHSISHLNKVKTISENYAFKNRSNYIEEYNYFAHEDDNDFIFTQDAEGLLKKKKKKTTYILRNKLNNEDRHNKFNDLIQNCIQDKNIIMKREICSKVK